MKVLCKDGFLGLMLLLSSSILTAQNIGIGTSTPVQTLDVNGRLRVANGVIQNGNTPITGTADLGLYSQAANSWMRFVTNNAPIKFFTENGNGGVGTTPKMVLTENGSLGIGSDNPAGKLHIKTDGAISAEQLDQHQDLAAGIIRGTNRFQTFTAQKTGLMKAIALWINPNVKDSLTIKIFQGNSLLSTTVNNKEASDLGDNFWLFPLATPVFVTSGVGYKIDLTVTPYYSQSAWLHIKSLNPYKHGYCDFYNSSGDDGPEYIWDIPFRTFVSASGNVDVVVNYGNLGIGTIYPSARLDVLGSVKIKDGSQGAGKVLTSDANGFATWAPLPVAIDPGTATGNTPFWNGTAWVTNSNNIFNNGGNVGIGIAAPTSKLHIVSSTANALRIDALANTSAFSIGGSGTFSIDAVGIAGGRMVVKDDGRVGIGTPTPKDLLDVAGKMSATGFMCRKGLSGDNSSINYFNFNWTGNSLTCYVDDVFVGTVSGLSDRRLKDNISGMPNTALAKLMQMNPVTFRYKNIPGTVFTGSQVLQEGFVADELQQIIPSAVNGEKDAVNKDGAIQPQTLNPLPIVAILTKSVQEQQFQIEALIKQNTILMKRLEALEKK